MKLALPRIVVATGFVAAAAIQFEAARYLSLFGAAPDLLLAWVFACSLLGRPAAGALLGFGAGIVEGALSGANMTQYALSSTVVGFALGAIGGSEIEVSPPVAMALVALGTLGSRMLLLFMAPQPDIGAYTAATIGTAIYNGVLALAFYAILRPMFRPEGMKLI